MTLLPYMNDSGYPFERAHPDDAGIDLYSTETVRLAPNERHLTHTGIRIALPPNTVGYVNPRSGNAHKKGISIVNAPGTVDSGYRGEVLVNLINLDRSAQVLEKGDRIAQLVVHPIVPVVPLEVDYLGSSERGASGHGSTGD